MQLNPGQHEGLDPTQDKPSHSEYQARKLLLGISVFVIAFAILGLCLMSRAMRFALLVLGLATAVFLWAVAKLIVYSVQNEKRERKNRSGQTAKPIE